MAEPQKSSQEKEEPRGSTSEQNSASEEEPRSDSPSGEKQVREGSGKEGGTTPGGPSRGGSSGAELPATAGESAEKASEMLDEADNAHGPVAAYRAAAKAWEIARRFTDDSKCRALADSAMARMQALKKQLPPSDSKPVTEKKINEVK